MNAPKIGIRDSGVGGLTVARRIREQIPNADLLYFADTAHVPYGEKSVLQIRHYALSISDFLINQGAQMIVFACNTTSALALETARARFEVPVFGVIQPGARGAALVSRGKVGVLATAATVASGVYSREIWALRPELETLEIACPQFVPLVEARQTDSPLALEACRTYLQPLLDFGADTVVLGCTHYPLLLAHLQTVAPHIQFIDPADALACEVAAQINGAAMEPIPQKMKRALIVEANSTTGEANPQTAENSSTVPAIPQKMKRDLGFGEADSTKNEAVATAQATRDIFWVSGARDGLEDWIATLLQIENPNLQTGPIFDL